MAVSQTLGPGPVLPAAGATAACQDCGSPISGNYCSNCGQETKIEVPSVRQFAHELMDQYIAVEGKLGRTLRVLLTQPGQLTLDYVQGRRQRYVRPLKLYVSVSVVFFGLLGILPDSIGNPFTETASDAQQEQPAVSQPAAPLSGAASDPGKAAAAGDKDAAPSATSAAAAPAAKAQPPAPQKDGATDLRQQIQQEVDADLKDDDDKDDKLAEAIKSKVDAEVGKHVLGKDSSIGNKGFAALSSPEQRKQLREKLADDAPYAMFFLLPYFAFLLRWLYGKNKQRYGVHLLFTVHLHCFFFILLMPMFLPFSWLRSALELAGALYTFLALRRVYGGTWGRTLWRMSLLWLFDFAAISATALSGVMTAVFSGSP